MTKKELKQIYYINREIILWKREAERFPPSTSVDGEYLIQKLREEAKSL